MDCDGFGNETSYSTNIDHREVCKITVHELQTVWENGAKKNTFTLNLCILIPVDKIMQPIL